MQTEQQAADSLREAREVLAQFITKRGDHETKLADIGRQRAELSYDAHLGDKQAQARLEKLHLAAAKADSEHTSIAAAIQTAQEKVRDAEAARAKAHKAAKAQEILDLLPALRSHGSGLDKAAAEVLNQYAGLQSVIRAIRTLAHAQYDDVGLPRDSSPVPSEQLLRVTCRRALIAALVSTDLEVEHLAPSSRHTGYELASGWADRAHGWARQFVEIPEAAE